MAHLAASILLLLASTAALHVHALPGVMHERLAYDDDRLLEEGTIRFADIDIAYTLFDVARPDKGDEPPEVKDIPTAVFLHGQKYTKADWVKLGTLEKVRDSGIRALAIDLPGFGKTPALPYSDNNMRSELLKTVLNFASTKVNSTLHLVSPSMSGRYAVPFLDRHGTMLSSWVAIAPVGVSAWGGPWEDTHNKVCMLALYGENDPLKRDIDVLRKVFKQSTEVILPGAGHACYLDRPEEFHKVLLKFLHKCVRGPKGEHHLAGVPYRDRALL